MSSSACTAHAEFVVFALLRDWLSGFKCVEESSSNMAESGMRFTKNQSKNLGKKLYNTPVQVS